MESTPASKPSFCNKISLSLSIAAPLLGLLFASDYSPMLRGLCGGFAGCIGRGIVVGGLLWLIALILAIVAFIRKEQNPSRSWLTFAFCALPFLVGFLFF